MSGIMYLGNQMVTPVITLGGGEYVGREVDSNGKYQLQTSDEFVLPDGIKDLGDGACARLFFPTEDGNNVIKTADFNNLETISGYRALWQCFEWSTAIKSINFSNLNEITGNDALYQLAYKSSIDEISFPELETISCNNALRSIAAESNKEVTLNFPKLKTISGNSAFDSSLTACYTKKISFPELETISGNSVFSQYYREPSDFLEAIEFPKLKTIGGRYCFNNFIFGSSYTKLKTVDFSSLEDVGVGGLNYFFSKQQTSIDFIEFPKLKTVSDEALSSFAPTSLKTLIFWSLNENSFGMYMSQFYDMLSGCSNCTVYFPASLESVIGNWTDVLAGFGGTNTTVIFGLPMVLNLTTIPENVSILYDGIMKDKTLYISDNQKDFVVFDSSSYKAILYTETDYAPDSHKDITFDMVNTTYNKITINVGVSLYNMYAKWGNYTIPLQEEETGVYSCYINADIGETIDILSDGSLYYQSINTSFTTTGEDVSITITPTERQTQTFVRPNLSSNGTLGGSSFAVTASTPDGAYNAVDGSMSSLWFVTGDCWYIIYNPNYLLLNSITFNYYESWGSIKGLVVYGSNDNVNWTELDVFSGEYATSYTANMTNKGWYKYYRFNITPTSTAAIAITNISFDGKEDIS